MTASFAPDARRDQIDTAPPAGNALLWVLAALAVVLSVLHPQPPAALLRLVDWHTVGALAGLLAITQALEASGAVQRLAQRVLLRVRDQRQLALALVLGAAALAALLTNDVSLFLLVPLVRAMSDQVRLPLARLVVLLALAVNAGSALTPIGNPQNLYLWQRSGLGFSGFVLMMVPTVAVLMGWLLAATWWLVPSAPLPAGSPSQAVQPLKRRLLGLSAALFAGFVMALEHDALAPALAVVALAYGVAAPAVLRRLDWALLATIALMFIDLRQLTALPAVGALIAQAGIGHGWRAYLAGIAASQVISNVPAAIALAPWVDDLPALAAGVNVGAFGCVLGSLANLIALRLARVPHGLWEYHRVSVPYLLLAGGSTWVLLSSASNTL